MKLFLGVLTLAFILAANLQYVFSGYGIKTASTLHLNVLAQSSSSGTSSGGTGSGSTSGSFTGNFCGDINYAPNRCINSTHIVEEHEVNGSGELLIGSDIVKTGLKKGTKYSVVYDKKNCDNVVEGSCCDQRKVGISVVTTNKL